MDWQTRVGDLQAREGQGIDEIDPGQLFEQIARVLKDGILRSVIGPALSSLGTEGIREQVANSASSMNEQQRTSLAKTLLSGLGSRGIDLGPILKRLGIDPSVAENPGEADAEDLAKLAAHAHEHDHGLFNRAMEFYTEYPLLIQTLGAIAIASIITYLTQEE
jgi:hypothetical protein